MKDDEQRRKNYYVDGDYSTNKATGRDEAELKQEWMGFSLSRTNIISNEATQKYNIELNRVATTPNLWVYKTWLESRVVAWAEQENNPIPFHYYNCSEGGIAGVLCKTEEADERTNIENWLMLDEICKRWKTRLFEDAIGEFLMAKDGLKWGIGSVVPNATGTAIAI
jgi:hypothetical protein